MSIHVLQFQDIFAKMNRTKITSETLNLFCQSRVKKVFVCHQLTICLMKLCNELNQEVRLVVDTFTWKK